MLFEPPTELLQQSMNNTPGVRPVLDTDPLPRPVPSGVQPPAAEPLTGPHRIVFRRNADELTGPRIQPAAALRHVNASTTRQLGDFELQDPLAPGIDLTGADEPASDLR